LPCLILIIKIKSATAVALKLLGIGSKKFVTFCPATWAPWLDTINIARFILLAIKN